MSSPDNTRKIVGGILIAAGIIIILAVGGWFVNQQVRAQQVRAQLQQQLTATPIPPASPTAAPTLAPSPAPIAAATTTAPAELSPTPQPTAAAPTASPTLSPAATIRPRPVVPTPTASPEVPVRLVIPALNIDAKVVEMGWEVVNTAAGPQSEWVIPKNAAGHHINSATMDQPGNLVISGHNNIDGKVFEAISMAWDDATRVRVDEFTDRSDILKGRQVRLYDALGKPVDYTITDFFRLRDSGVSLAQRLQNARFIDPTDDSRITLVTCWPPWSNTHRLVVIAKPTQP